MNDFDNKQICSYKDIDRFGFTCDVCGRKVNGCHYINGMKFCAKCYQETFGKDNQQNEIQQLKQQLEEKDNYHLRYELAGADETITNLKKQIEEKDKEIEKLKTKQKPIVMHSKENYYFLEEENIKLHFAQKQLAIQELEKVKSSLFSKAIQITGTGVDCVRLYEINKIINQQIKELKGE